MSQFTTFISWPIKKYPWTAFYCNSIIVEIKNLEYLQAYLDIEIKVSKIKSGL